MQAERQRAVARRGGRLALVASAAAALLRCSSGDSGRAGSDRDAGPTADAGAPRVDAASDALARPPDAPPDASPPGDATPEAHPADAEGDRGDATGAGGARPDAAEGGGARCPADTVDTGQTCMDRYEAPNFAGALPLVMLTFSESEAWCAARGKRLCFDDEWGDACAGSAGHAYPYGDAHQPGVCNDDERWLAYDQALLDGWPWSLPTATVASLEALLELARSAGPAATLAADHVQALYQAEPSGANAGCVSEAGVHDLSGNVEEWTRRRDGGGPSFHGSLRGRYWADSRTCQSAVTSHGDAFRFYEIGLRCCVEPR
ncbi:MAG: SUMF1/EgtB/PvdO family nonheme iron enzyme [Polyangiaceae bacterium]|nr:SUMF1/EgtB/PvdO family nonheme iron enzyme [Polyangiaceae bacterium]